MRQDCLRSMPSRRAPVPFELILHAAATGRSDFLPNTIPNTISTPTPDSLRRAVWLYRFAVDRAHEIPSSSPLQCREVKVTELVAKKLPIHDPIRPEPTAYRCEATVDEKWAYELQYVVPQTETQGLLTTELGYGKLTVSRVRD